MMRHYDVKLLTDFTVLCLDGRVVYATSIYMFGAERLNQRGVELSSNMEVIYDLED